MSELDLAPREFKKLMVQAQEENWPQERLQAAMFEHAPDSIKQQMLATMPESVRRYVDGDTGDSD